MQIFTFGRAGSLTRQAMMSRLHDTLRWRLVAMRKLAVGALSANIACARIKARTSESSHHSWVDIPHFSNPLLFCPTSIPRVWYSLKNCVVSAFSSVSCSCLLKYCYEGSMYRKSYLIAPCNVVDVMTLKLALRMICWRRLPQYQKLSA